MQEVQTKAGSFLGYPFKCPRCGRKCNPNKKMGKMMSDDMKKVFYWECNGQSPQSPHPPCSYRLEPLSIVFGNTGAKVTEVDEIQELWLEDSEVYNLTDEWKLWMREHRYERLAQQTP